VEPAAGKGAAGGAENAGRVPGLKTRYASGPKNAFLQFGANPLFTTSKGSIQDQVLTLCGRKHFCRQPGSLAAGEP
jgi:hypothetical protein